MNNKESLAGASEDAVVIGPNRTLVRVGLVVAPLMVAMGVVIMLGIWPKGFDLGNRLFRGPLLTLLGIWVIYSNHRMFRTQGRIILDRNGIQIPDKDQIRWSEIDRIDMPSLLSISSNVATIRLLSGRKVYVYRVQLECGLKRFCDTANSMHKRYT
jgi:hypothetical protein